MRYAILLTALLGPSLLVGCKKKEPEPAPVAAAPAPKALLDWTFGPATFAGSRADGNTGALTVPWTVVNKSGSGLVLTAVAVNIFNGEEKICGSKANVSDKTADGGTLSGKVEIPCEYKTLPATEKLSAKATALYELGGETKDEKVSLDLEFTR